MVGGIRGSRNLEKPIASICKNWVPKQYAQFDKKGCKIEWNGSRNSVKVERGLKQRHPKTMRRMNASTTVPRQSGSPPRVGRTVGPGRGWALYPPTPALGVLDHEASRS